MLPEMLERHDTNRGCMLTLQDNRDKRVELLQKYAFKFFPTTKYLNYALQVEIYTLQKAPNLVMNVDGCIGTLFLDLLHSSSLFTEVCQNLVFVHRGVSLLFFHPRGVECPLLLCFAAYETACGVGSTVLSACICCVAYICCFTLLRSKWWHVTILLCSQVNTQMLHEDWKSCASGRRQHSKHCL